MEERVSKRLAHDQPEEIARHAHPGMKEHPHRAFGSERERGRAEEEMQIASQPGAGNQPEPAHPLRVLIRQGHCDATAKAVPDCGHEVEMEPVEDVAHRRGLGAQGVVGIRLVAPAATRQVKGDHLVAAGQRGDDAVPRLGGVRDPVQEKDRLALPGSPVEDARATR
jgi:hypothetical protein